MTNKMTLPTIITSMVLLTGFMGFAIGNPDVFAAPSKVTVCHIPPGDPGNAHTIDISENALDVHLAHGDELGACGTSIESTESCTYAICNADPPACFEGSCDSDGKCVYAPATTEACSLK